MMQTQVTRKRPRGEDNAFPDPFHPRRATNSNPNQYEQHPQSMYNESQNQDQSLWSDQSMFALDAPALDAELFQYTEPDWPADAFQDIFLPSFGSPAWMASMPSFLSGAHTHNDLDHTGQAWLEQTLYPDVPSLEERFVDLTLDNPYSENAIVRHKTLRKALAMPEDGAVNGYIKFRIRNADLDERSSKRAKGLVGGLSVRSRDTSSPSQSPFSNIPYLPPDFGRGVKLDEVDSKLLKFYLVAYCQGRTLLAKTNFWLTEIASMMASEDAVKHAILALAGAYVLDYVFKDDLRNRTNAHYRKASELIGAALKRPEVHTVGEGDGIVAAILLLVVDDCVNWEIRRPKGEVPNWYRGAHLAKAILDHSDPGYRYWKRENVQCDRARAANANWTALACILGLAVTPLNLCDNDRNFGWLLEGSAREAHTIHGGTGLSPKLLHIYAQITYLAARMMKNPESVVTPLAAVKIQESLQDFRQRSELSEGYPTTTALLDSCILDVTGKVDNATKVTELTGETWVCAAKIYLHCRFFRKPRCHPDVIDALDTLIVCVRRMPCSGALFTSQAPFFCIFIMALVAFREEDRAAAREWFKTVLSAVSCRSSVPPVWDCIQLLWEWMDTELTSEEKFDDSIPIGQRRAWWEDMIAYLIDKVGWVSLT